MSGIRPISASRLRKIFEKAGWRVSRIQGDHMIMIKDGATRPLVIPVKRELPVFIIKNNLRTAGISREEYLRLADKTK